MVLVAVDVSWSALGSVCTATCFRCPFLLSAISPSPSPPNCCFQGFFMIEVT
ncbi:hypothetical protein HBI05_121970 [Parastagonospora nodorum]|nr:hypothetical protein HBI05_121970 [Parastagonospora nodorum]